MALGAEKAYRAQDDGEASRRMVHYQILVEHENWRLQTEGMGCPSLP